MVKVRKTFKLSYSCAMPFVLLTKLISNSQKINNNESTYRYLNTELTLKQNSGNPKANSPVFTKNCVMPKQSTAVIDLVAFD